MITAEFSCDFCETKARVEWGKGDPPGWVRVDVNSQGVGRTAVAQKLEKFKAKVKQSLPPGLPVQLMGLGGASRAQIEAQAPAVQICLHVCPDCQVGPFWEVANKRLLEACGLMDDLQIGGEG